MSFGKFIEKTVKAAGIITKVGIELGADLVGKVAEKVDDNPATSEKYSKLGKKAGRTIKEYTSSAGKNAGEAVDTVLDKGIKAGGQLGRGIASIASEAFDTLSSRISELRTKPTSRDEFIENVIYDIEPSENQNPRLLKEVNYKSFDKDLELSISGTFESITKTIDKSAVEFEYKGIFDKKRERAISLNDYRHSLLRNTWYYAEMGPQMLLHLKSYLELRTLPEFEAYLNKLEFTQEEYKQKSKVMDFSKMLDDIEQLEFSYKYHSIYTDLLFNFLNVLTNKENDKLREEVLLYTPDEVIKLCNKYLEFSTNVLLDNINFKY